MEESGFAGEKRRSAMRAAALAFGSQGGLARRGWEIARMLERHGPKLSAVYRFRDLMLHYHGFTVMPPVLAETGRAFRLDRDGARAASARRVLRIVEPERIVSAVPHWRDFLLRDWPEAVPPAAILYPRDEAEARQWRRWLTQMLLPNPQGGRTAIREWLAFDGALKAALMEVPQQRWPVLMAEALRRTGNDLASAAETAWRQGRIGEADRRRVLAASAGPASGADPGVTGENRE